MSDISLGCVVVHRLIKEQHKDFDHSKPYSRRDTVLDRNNEIVIKLVSSIAALYGKKSNSSHYGIFNLDETRRGPFPAEFDKYRNDTSKKLDDELFIGLSKNVMHQLYIEAKDRPAASGGLLLFADYISKSVRYFLIAMIKQKEGIVISDKLEPKELEHLDLAKLNQAARINYDLYDKYISADENERQDVNYLSFVSPSSNQTTSGYFITALGCDKGNTSTKATSNLINESFNFFRNHQELKDNARKFKNEIIEYLFDCSENNISVKLSVVSEMAAKHMVNLEDDIKDKLSEELYAHLNSESIRVPVEFRVSKSVVKKNRNIKYTSDNVNFEFKSSLLGNTLDNEICYNKKTGHLTFTRITPEKKSEIAQLLDELIKERNSEK